MYKMKNSPCDGMVDITDLKSVALKAWKFESPRGHQLGDKCYGSTSGSNPLRQGSIPWSPAKIGKQRESLAITPNVPHKGEVER